MKNKGTAGKTGHKERVKRMIEDTTEKKEPKMCVCPLVRIDAAGGWAECGAVGECEMGGEE